jgi:hypothetical protein
MPTPVIGTVETVVSSTSSTTALASATKTVATGDIFIAIACTEDANSTIGVFTDSNSRLTWTQYKTLGTAGSDCYVRLSYGKVASTGTTVVSSGTCTLARWHSMTIWQITGAQLDTTPAFISNANAGTAPTANITTTAANSLVIVGHADFTAMAPGTPAYRNGGAQDGIHDKSTTVYVAYYYHAAVASASTVAMGQTTPTGQHPSMLAIEVKDVGGATVGLPEIVLRQRIC